MPVPVSADQLVELLRKSNLVESPRLDAFLAIDARGGVTVFSGKVDLGTGVRTAITQIAADALFQRAARLPRVDVRKPPTVIGRTTIGAIESGLFYGYLGMVEGIMGRMASELGGRITGIATGGLAPLIVPETRLFEAMEPDITLHGLKIIWERNQ